MAQALWCTLNNEAIGQAMSAASFNGEVIDRRDSLRYPGIHFDRMLASNLLKLDRVRNEAIKAKAYLNAMQNPKNLLHDAVKEEQG